VVHLTQQQKSRDDGIDGPAAAAAAAKLEQLIFVVFRPKCLFIALLLAVKTSTAKS